MSTLDLLLDAFDPSEARDFKGRWVGAHLNHIARSISKTGGDRQKLGAAFADKLAANNPRFKREMFMRAVESGAVRESSPTFTKAHFEDIASTLRQSGMSQHAPMFADRLAGTNPLFNRETFLKAAGTRRGVNVTGGPPPKNAAELHANLLRAYASKSDEELQALTRTHPTRGSRVDPYTKAALEVLRGRRKGKRVQEAADSLAKASTPEPFSTSRTSNWVARVGGLPDYIQHIAHDLMEKRGMTESRAIATAIAIVKNPPRNWGAEARAAAAKAAAEWEAKKASSRAKAALQHSEYVTLGDIRALEEAAVERIRNLVGLIGADGLARLLDGSAPLQASEEMSIAHGEELAALADQAEVDLAVALPLAERFSAAELRDFRGRWRVGGVHTPSASDLLPLRSMTPEELHATASRPAVGRAETLRRHGRRSVSSRHELPLHLGGARSAAVRQALGSHRDTREKYSTLKGGKRVYTKERKAHHRKLIEELFRESGAKPQAPGERHVVFVAGGPGSGKSSAEEHMPKHPHSVEIDQDYFKNKIREFQTLAAKRDPYASDAAHREGADIAHQARLEAMRRGYNVVVQGAGNSGPGQFARKIVEARQSGYRPHAFYVSAPTEIALERARARAEKTGRAVPEAGARAMHANVSKRFPEVAAVAHALESLQVFDSREDTRKGGKARRIIHLDAVAQRIVHDNPKLAAEFLAKQHEDAGTLIRQPHYV